VTADSSVGRERRRALAGTLSAVMGLAAVGTVAFIGLISFQAFNPPAWAPSVSLLLLPVSLTASVLLGIVGWRSAGRARAVAGLALCALAVVAFWVICVIAMNPNRS